MRKFALGLVVATTLAASACSLISPSGEATSSAPSVPPPTTAPTAPSASNQPPTGPSSDPSASSATSAPTDQLGQSVATRQSAKAGKKITLTLYPVVRDGTTSHLNFTLAADVESTEKVQIADLLSDNNASAGDSGPWATDGIQLIDGKNSKVYLVASDGQKHCLCSDDLAGVFLSDNVPVILSSTFAAPPPDVTTVDVRVPNFGTVADVPVA
ncbi:MAG TPA: hypothetical protein VIT20_07950 [Propionibacteriaceae bacterium]